MSQDRVVEVNEIGIPKERNHIYETVSENPQNSSVTKNADSKLAEIEKPATEENCQTKEMSNADSKPAEIEKFVVAEESSQVKEMSNEDYKAAEIEKLSVAYESVSEDPKSNKVNEGSKAAKIEKPVVVKAKEMYNEAYEPVVECIKEDIVVDTNESS